MAFKEAVKRDAKLRFAICGPGGSGKTMTLLRIAKELASGGRIAFDDTEHGSASKYAHTDTCGGEGVCKDWTHFKFYTHEPDSYSPDSLIALIDEVVADGYKVLCVDSLSHYWMGKDGELDMVETASKRTKGNSFAAWKFVTPTHNKLVDKILSAPIHILVSMRTKTEWVLENDEQGKSKPKKVGLAPIMREGIDYEMDIAGDIDQDNILTITKSRCPDLSGKVIAKPGKEMAEIIKVWLTGAPAEPVPVKPATITEDQQKAIFKLMHTHGKSQDNVKAILKLYGFSKTADITLEKYDEICAMISTEITDGTKE